jgi:hypothetical protein
VVQLPRKLNKKQSFLFPPRIRSILETFPEILKSWLYDLYVAAKDVVIKPTVTFMHYAEHEPVLSKIVICLNRVVTRIGRADPPMEKVSEA